MEFSIQNSWYWSPDAVMSVPAQLDTRGAELRNIIQNIEANKTAELGMSLLVKESSGRKIKVFVRLYLTGCVH